MLSDRKPTVEQEIVRVCRELAQDKPMRFTDFLENIKASKQAISIVLKGLVEEGIIAKGYQRGNDRKTWYYLKDEPPPQRILIEIFRLESQPDPGFHPWAQKKTPKVTKPFTKDIPRIDQGLTKGLPTLDQGFTKLEGIRIHNTYYPNNNLYMNSYTFLGKVLENRVGEVSNIISDPRAPKAPWSEKEIQLAAQFLNTFFRTLPELLGKASPEIVLELAQYFQTEVSPRVRAICVRPRALASPEWSPKVISPTDDPSAVSSEVPSSEKDPSPISEPLTLSPRDAIPWKTPAGVRDSATIPDEFKDSYKLAQLELDEHGVIGNRHPYYKRRTQDQLDREFHNRFLDVSRNYHPGKKLRDTATWNVIAKSPRRIYLRTARLAADEYGALYEHYIESIVKAYSLEELSPYRNIATYDRLSGDVARGVYRQFEMTVLGDTFRLSRARIEESLGKEFLPENYKGTEIQKAFLFEDVLTEVDRVRRDGKLEFHQLIQTLITDKILPAEWVMDPGTMVKVTRFRGFRLSEAPFRLYLQYA